MRPPLIPADERVARGTGSRSNRRVRVLLTSRGSSGHVTPLAPFGHACLRAGHEVLVAAQGQRRAEVQRTGLQFSPLGDPPPEEWMPLMGRFAQMSFDESNAAMIGEFFARIDTTAMLPGLRTLVEDWRPDVIVRESWEFASTIVAELHGIPLARVALGLVAVEEVSIETVAAAIDDARRAVGLPADPAGDRLRDTPYLTMVPEPLEDPEIAAPASTHRFSPGPPEPASPLPDWWPGNDDPLVYVTFGSVAAGGHLPYYPALYRAAIDALAPLPARILITIGEDRPVEELEPLPANVHVERWVPHDAVAPHAAAIVCHGGHGSTIGSLRRGVPLVVLPLFSMDQRANAAAVARSGAGVALDADLAVRGALQLPSEQTLGALGPAVARVLDDASYRDAARRIAESASALPPVDAAVEVLEALRA
jgi:UDP:flavonoid glycosyltransferase YjiC (YdhE family)